MIGLDTNVLVRYLTQDDPIQSPKAADLIERALTELDFQHFRRRDIESPRIDLAG